MPAVNAGSSLADGLDNRTRDGRWRPFMLYLARALELRNGLLVLQKIRTPDNRVGKLLARNLPAAEVLEELFLATLSRPPLLHEKRVALDVVGRVADKRVAWESVHWALLNTNEFLFRH
jgi:hypothetical protein